MGDFETFAERRKYKRVEKKVEAMYKIISTQDSGENAREVAVKREAGSANISEGGIQLLIDGRQLEKDQIVGIELMTSEEKKIRTFAEVRWASFDPEFGKYRTGFEFLAIKDDDKEIIKEIIYN